MKKKRQEEKAQDKATTNKGLKYLVEKLEQIATSVCDGCANSNNTASNILQQHNK